MSNNDQRIGLKKYLDTDQYFKATFGEIRHDKKNQPEVLLLNVYPVYETGKKVPLRGQNVLKTNKGLAIVADHLWTPLTPEFLKQKELLYQDEIMFKAHVIAYPISRKNVREKRDDIWINGKKESQKVYRDYEHLKNNDLEMLWHLTQDATQKVFEAHKNHLITFTEMKQEQKQLMRNYKKKRRQAFASMKQKQKRRIKKAKQQIIQEELVDYTLDDVHNLNVIKYNKKLNKYRVKYDPNRINDLSYTKFLAAHSQYAAQNKLKEWK